MLIGTWHMTGQDAMDVSFSKGGIVQRGRIGYPSVSSGNFKVNGDQVSFHFVDMEDDKSKVMDETYSMTWYSADKLKLTFVPFSRSMYTAQQLEAEALRLTKVSTSEFLNGSGGLVNGSGGGQPAADDTGDQCLEHVKDLTLAATLYASDFDGVWPAQTWEDSIRPYVKNVGDFDCPELLKQGGSNGYAMNAMLEGANTARIPSPGSLPAIYDSNFIGMNALAPPASLPNPARHRAGNNVGYADGHAGRAFVGN